jgi:hypothetical protein
VWDATITVLVAGAQMPMMVTGASECTIYCQQSNGIVQCRVKEWIVERLNRSMICSNSTDYGTDQSPNGADPFMWAVKICWPKITV